LLTSVDEEFLDNARVAAKTRNGELLSLTGSEVSRSLVVLMALEEKNVAVVPEEVRAN